MPVARTAPAQRGLTNTVERAHASVTDFNLTLRQRLSRFVRKTLSFSKSKRMHWVCLRLFLDAHNRYCIGRFSLLDNNNA